MSTIYSIFHLSVNRSVYKSASIKQLSRSACVSILQVMLVCNTTDRAIIAPLAWDFFLILMCTVYAVKTRNLPENFNEAKFIGFSMYTTCVIWVSNGVMEVMSNKSSEGGVMVVGVVIIVVVLQCMVMLEEHEGGGIGEVDILVLVLPMPFLCKALSTRRASDRDVTSFVYRDLNFQACRVQCVFLHRFIDIQSNFCEDLRKVNGDFLLNIADFFLRRITDLSCMSITKSSREETQGALVNYETL